MSEPLSKWLPVGRWVCVLDRRGGSTEFEVIPEVRRPSPATARAGSIVVVFDGRLTDRRELLASPGAASTSADDAHAILDAYCRLGERVLSRLSGTFVLVVWDGERDTLLCVRDPIGIHPLLYTQAGRSFAVAPFVEPLLRRPDMPPRVDPVAATFKILGLPLGPEETLFTSVRRVPPGHALEASPAGMRLFRYWDPGEPGSEEGLTPREAAERFDVLARQAVGRCIESGPTAVYVSGGIDSAAVAAVAAELSGERRLSPPLGLSLVIKHPDLDEESKQQAVAGDLGMELLPASIDQAVGSGGLLRATLEVSMSGSAGPADILQPIFDFLSHKGLRRGRGTFLNGQGGDEWLLPPHLYGADRLRALDLPALYRLWHAWYDYLPFRSNASFARHSLWTWGARPFVRAAVLRAGRSESSVRDLLARRFLERLPAWLAPDAALRRDIVERALFAVPRLPCSDLYRTSRRALLDSPDRPGMTEEAFATQRRIGARILMPFLDADVVRFLYRLPPDLLVHGGHAKALARHVVAQRVPTFGASWPRTVTGDSYFRALIERETPRAWREAGGTPYLADLGIVDESSVRRLVREGSSPSWLWPATNVDAWLRSCLGAEPISA